MGLLPLRPSRFLLSTLGLFAGVSVASSCAPRLSYTDAIHTDLERRAGSWVRQHDATFRGILDQSLGSDAYHCAPLPEMVFRGPAVPGSRVIRGSMPHYGIYFGPMHYRLAWDGAAWKVVLRIAVVPPAADDVLELADCDLRPKLQGPVVCRGIPFSRSGKREACPGSGVFRAPASRHNVEALLQRWSDQAEGYYNRDARRFGIPVVYDFDLRILDDPSTGTAGADMVLPLATTCARTPYFTALRSAWSLPIVAHELGHMLGLLDEYEFLSGIFGFYPKTPFRGAEKSRMGLSMMEDTILWPVHHYLVLRRYFCPEPLSRDPYEDVFASPGK